MKRAHKVVCQNLLLLLVLFLTAYGGPQPVRAEVDNQDGLNRLRIIPSLSTPSSVCIGKTTDFQFKFLLWIAPRLVPTKGDTAVINISAKKGTINLKKHQILNIINDHTYVVDFSYKALKEGDEKILIKISIGKNFKNELPLEFKVKKCKASLQFNQQTTLNQGVVSISNTYSGTGSLSVDKDGQVSGSGSQLIWADILPYSAEGGSCTHSPPWEGGSGISFSGQIGTDGASNVKMDLQALSVNSSTLTCTGGDYSASSAWPGYTYESCQIVLDDFNFESGTLDVPFNCPGEEPYTVSITVIPRSE